LLISVTQVAVSHFALSDFVTPLSLIELISDFPRLPLSISAGKEARSTRFCLKLWFSNSAAQSLPYG
jgi:hypothetical protein